MTSEFNPSGERPRLRAQSLLKWFLYPLVMPCILLCLLLFAIPVGLPALVLCIYWTVYPERHAHLYDFDRNPRHRELLAKWRGVYARMSFRERYKRFALVRRRRKRLGNQRVRRESAMIRNYRAAQQAENVGPSPPPTRNTCLRDRFFLVVFAFWVVISNVFVLSTIAMLSERFLRRSG